MANNRRLIAKKVISKAKKSVQRIRIMIKLNNYHDHIQRSKLTNVP